jgi:hypothetical protein
MLSNVGGSFSARDGLPRNASVPSQGKHLLEWKFYRNKILRINQPQPAKLRTREMKILLDRTLRMSSLLVELLGCI